MAEQSVPGVDPQVQQATEAFRRDYRAVKAEDGESIVFALIEWPDKQARDQAWEKIMKDERMQPQGEMPFDGKRMFWGGFEKVVDSADARLTVSA